VAPIPAGNRGSPFPIEASVNTLQSAEGLLCKQAGKEQKNAMIPTITAERSFLLENAQITYIISE
jgi:hypothetical protein